MKKIIRFGLILLLSLVMTGCSLFNSNMRNLSAPNINKTPINGSWVVTKIIFTNENKNYFEFKDKIGSDTIFSTKGFILNGYYFENPTIKSKIVNTQKFLNRYYQITPDVLGIDTDELTVVNLYNSKDLVYQVLKAQENLLYVYTDGIFLQLSRVSEDISDEEFAEVKNREEKELVNLKEKLDENSKDNGILLGIKYKMDSEIAYKGFYIKCKEDEVESVDQFNEIKIDDGENILSLKGENKFVVITDSDGEIKYTTVNDNYQSVELMYISNEYTSLFFGGEKPGDDSLVFKKTVDFNKDTKISFSKLIENGDEIFEAEALKNGHAGYINDSNFGIQRKDGKFNLVGLMVYKNNKAQNILFDLNVDVSRILDSNSELAMTFESIKASLPDTTDAVMSSNNRFIVTIENNTLNIYNISKADSGFTKVFSAEIPEDSQIVQVEKFVGSNSIQMKNKLNSN